MTQSKHTPTPWAQSELKRFGYNITSGDKLIGQVYLEREADEKFVTENHKEFDREAKNNAAFIVKAVNCHEELVALLEAYRNGDQITKDGVSVDYAAQQLLAKAGAA